MTNPAPDPRFQEEEDVAKVLPFPTARPATETVLLVGNPNVGKSLLFKNLTNRYVNVSNFPGATVVQVADAKNLRRALLLTLQIAELGHPMILALNMLDELAARGGWIDMEKLSHLLGIPVVGTIALRNQGTAELVAALKGAGPAHPFGTDVGAAPCGLPDDPYDRNRARLARVHEILTETYQLTQPSAPPSGCASASGPCTRSRRGLPAGDPGLRLLVRGPVRRRYPGGPPGDRRLRAAGDAAGHPSLGCGLALPPHAPPGGQLLHLRPASDSGP